MNEFTKEELIWLEKEMSESNEMSVFDKTGKSVYKKVRSMIDNYCDHRFVFTLNDSHVHCHKCGRKLNDHQ